MRPSSAVMTFPAATADSWTAYNRNPGSGLRAMTRRSRARSQGNRGPRVARSIKPGTVRGADSGGELYEIAIFFGRARRSRGIERTEHDIRDRRGKCAIRLIEPAKDSDYRNVGGS